MTDIKEQFKNLLSEIIAKQVVILGPSIAIFKARKVQGLIITDDGRVTDIEGDPYQIAKNLVDEYINLSGQIIKSIIEPIFEKYPAIKKIE